MEVLKKWYVILSAILAALYTLATIDSDGVSKNFHLLREWYLSTPVMTGSWSSSYYADEKNTLTANEWLEDPEQTVMDLVVYDGKFDGVVSSPAIRRFIKSTPQITDYFLLEGEKDLFRNSGIGYVYEYIYGEKYLFAVVKLKIEDDQMVMTNITEGGSEFVPEKVILLKRSDAAFDDRLKEHSKTVAWEKVEQYKKDKTAQKE